MDRLKTISRRLYRRLMVWRIRNVGDRAFLVIAAVLVGVCGGIAAALLKLLVHEVEHLLTLGIPPRYQYYLFFIYPLIGILLTVIYRQAFNYGTFGIGISHLLLDISRRSANVKRHKMHSHIVSSALTVGFGGSVGLESPIVTTGAAIGSNAAKFLHMDYYQKVLLLGCGVAAGIAGVFQAPIAGVLFCMEVLLLELSAPMFVPLLMASVAGSIVSSWLAGSTVLFSDAIIDPFLLSHLPWYIFLGIMAGVMAIYFKRTFNNVQQWLQKVTDPYRRAILGSLCLGVLIFLLPPLYGEGYATMKNLLAGRTESLVAQSSLLADIEGYWVIFMVALAFVFFKAIAAGLTIGAGGNGGTFAPSLVTGGMVGFFVAHLVNSIGFLDVHLSERNFMLVGMAGMMSGVLHAPLTAIFVIAEITSGYEILIPLMAVAATAFFTSSYIEPHSMYLKQLRGMGHVLSHDHDTRALHMLKIARLIEKDFVPVPLTGNLRDVVEAVSRSSRHLFPIVDESGRLMGLLMLDNIRNVMFRPEMYDELTVRQLLQPPPEILHSGQSMDEAMQAFDRTRAWNLPVTDKEGHYLGMLSRSKIFGSYRSALRRQIDKEVEL